MNKNLKPTVMLTQEGLEELKKELKELKEVKLPQVVERVSLARADGDLSENGAYQFGRQEQEFLEGRIDELQEILSNSTLIQKSTASGSNKLVDVGCKVTVSINGKNQTFSVVGDWEAKPAEKKISGNSPLGKALMGRKVGEKAEVDAPAGKVHYTIVSIE